MLGHFFRGACAALLACVLLTARAEAQTSIEIYAGGSPFVEVSANTVPVSPKALAVAPNGDLYVADDASGKLLRFDPATSRVNSVPNLPGMLEYRFSSPQALGYGPQGSLNLVAGQEQWQLDLIDGSKNNLGPVSGVVSATFAPDGSLYFTRSADHAIYLRALSGSVVTLAGSTLSGFSGDGTASARFNNPRGLAIDAVGNLYIADSGNRRVRRRDAATGIITTIAGTGFASYNGTNLLALQTNLQSPSLLAFDTAGNLYIYDEGVYRIRKLTAATGRITDFAGNGVPGNNPDNGIPAILSSLGVVASMKAASNGAVYIAEADSYRVRKIDTNGTISRIIGNGTRSFCGEGVPAREACLNRPNGIAIDDAGDVYVSDQNNRRIRKISAGTGLITTIAGGSDSGPEGNGGPALAARFPAGTAGLAVDPARNLYVAATGRVHRIDHATGIITTFAGTSTPGFAGDGGPAIAARFNGVSRVALDASGNLYISDIYGNRVRRVDAATGIINTVAGNGLGTGPLGDGGPAVNASLSWPHNLAFDPAGNLLIGDTNHYRIRKVNLATGVITTIAGNGSIEISGDSGPATAAGIGDWPAIAVDGNGNVYVAAGSELRRIDAQTGIIDQAPAPIWGLYTPEGRGLENPNDMVLGADQRLYITDAATNNLVLRVSGLPTPTSDLTPPVIEPVVSGTPGTNGWYRSDVQLTWSVTDPESAVTATSGCEQSQINLDTGGVSFQCTAASTGGTAHRTVVIKRDTVAPQLTFGTRSPAADASGWNSTDVSVAFTTSDSLSGVYSTSSGNPVQITGEGAGLTGQVVVTDGAGNVASYTTPAVNIDRTGPTVAANVSGTLGSNGWYTSDVEVAWTTIDDNAPVSATTGCGTSFVTADTAGVTFTCTASSAGGSSTASVTVKRDTTPPQLSFSAPAPAPNSMSWFASDVSIAFDATDATSGVASASAGSPVIISGEGANLTSQVIVTDAAGNSATFSTPAVSIDRSPPSIVSAISGVTGNNGWYTSDVQITWVINESPSSIISSDGCSTVSQSADTAGVTFTCSVVSQGGTASSSVTVKRDATPPVLSFGSPTPAVNVNGWNKTNVSIPFTRTDVLSGLASTSITSPLVISSEGADVTGQVVVTDLAGNSATFTSVPRNIDKAAPVVVLTSPADGANYGFYQDVTGDFSCTDLSLLSCVGTTSNGDLVNTKTAGARTFKVTGKDLALFTTAVTHSFTVESLFNFAGFLAPVSEPPTLNLVTRGSLVPIRWQLPDGNGGFVSNTASFTSATVGSLTCGSATAVPLNDTASGASGISFDAGTNTFTYNWQTNAGWTGCRKLTIKLRDNTLHELQFKFQ